MPLFAREIAKEIANGSDVTQDAFKERLVECHKMLAEVWMLGEQVMMPAMQNEAMDEILALMKQTLTPAAAIGHGFGLGSGLKLGEAYAVQARHQYLEKQTMDHSDMAQLAKVDGLLGAVLGEVREALSLFEVKFRSASHKGWDFRVDED